MKGAFSMANFQNDYKKVVFADILDYVRNKEPDYEKVLQQSVKEGKGFLTIKNEFYDKFFPEYRPVAKPKKPTMRELLGLSKK